MGRRKVISVKVSKRTGLKTHYSIVRSGGREVAIRLKKRSAIQVAKNVAKKTGKTYYVIRKKPVAKVSRKR